MKFSAINHDTRKSLGINAIQYMVVDAIAQFESVGERATAEEVALRLGLTDVSVRLAVGEMEKCEPALITTNEHGWKVPSREWYKAQFGGIEVQITEQHRPLVESIVNHFNEVNKTQYRASTYEGDIVRILKSNPKYNFDHFSAIIRHKNLDWGVDPKMSKFNRPATLFQSPKKFARYLDDAITYFREIARSNQATAVKTY